MGESNKIEEMLLAIWRTNYPVMMARLVVLQNACQALDAGSLDDVTRGDAYVAAHKLAGVLGTFGLPEGSDIASQLEASLGPEGGVPDKQSFSDSVAKLEKMIEAKPR
ncbi:Hpt domain-containing protein [Silvibacterium acidisoli]|uniref:Hpt domain-containing protein n=1 Tax=Acidobacteriaceae bacterium ZG23-2 TaxID=2883246 RepID=UPI00406C74AA